MPKQNGLEQDNIQAFQGPHWGAVTPFAANLTRTTALGAQLYFDPGAPPCPQQQRFRDDMIELLAFSSHLTPDDPTTMNISPSARGSSTLGTDDGTGRAVNPFTGQAYPATEVSRADYERVIAEFWADGPSSETPPGICKLLAAIPICSPI